MDLIRLGEKIISRRKIGRALDEILSLRVKGMSQTEVAARMGVDRTLVSRLESLGEIRKGRTLAVVGFPILNKEEVREALEGEGVDLVFLMSEKERWDYLSDKSGLTLFDSILDKIAMLQSFDQIVMVGSNKRIKTVETVLNKEVVGLEIGESPIQEDKYVEIDKVVELVRLIKK